MSIYKYIYTYTNKFINSLQYIYIYIHIYIYIYIIYTHTYIERDKEREILPIAYWIVFGLL